MQMILDLDAVLHNVWPRLAKRQDLWTFYYMSIEVIHK